VKVDEAGRDELTGDVDTLNRSGGRNARLDRRDLAMLDPDVSLAPESLAWIEHVAVRDHEVVLQRRVPRIEAVRRGRAGLGNQERICLGVDAGWLRCESGAVGGGRPLGDEVGSRDAHSVVLLAFARG